MTSDFLIKIDLPICPNESGRPGTEVIVVEPLCSKRFRLLYSPGTVEGLAKGDVIELSDNDPKGFNVVSRSGNLCVWFYFGEQGGNRGPGGDAVRAAAG